MFLMCLLFLPVNVLLVFARRMVGVLSWYRRLLSIVYPCTSMKYLHHKIILRTLVVLATSDSVELATFILCFLAMFTIAPFPIDIIALDLVDSGWELSLRRTTAVCPTATAGGRGRLWCY